MAKYSEDLRDKPFENYNEYMQYIFDCVNTSLDKYITHMKSIYSQGEGNGYKNVLYPDIEIAGDNVHTKLEQFYTDSDADNDQKSDDDEDSDFFDDLDDEEGEEDEDLDESVTDEDDIDEELLALLGSFSESNVDNSLDTSGGKAKLAEKIAEDKHVGVYDRIKMIEERAELTIESGVKLPFHTLCKKLEFEPFTLFCFACGILSSTQTD